MPAKGLPALLELEHRHSSCWQHLCPGHGCSAGMLPVLLAWHTASRLSRCAAAPQRAVLIKAQNHCRAAAEPLLHPAGRPHRVTDPLDAPELPAEPAQLSNAPAAPVQPPAAPAAPAPAEPAAAQPAAKAKPPEQAVISAVANGSSHVLENGHHPGTPARTGSQPLTASNPDPPEQAVDSTSVICSSQELRTDNQACRHRGRRGQGPRAGCHHRCGQREWPDSEDVNQNRQACKVGPAESGAGSVNLKPCRSPPCNGMHLQRRRIRFRCMPSHGCLYLS